MKANKHKTKTRWLKYLVGLLVFLAIIVFAINPILKNLLANVVKSRLAGNFDYSYLDLKVDLLSRSVSVKNVTWGFPKGDENYVESGRIESFEVRGISLLSLWKKGELRISSINFNTPELVTLIDTSNVDTPTSDFEQESFNFYALLQGNLNSLKIDNIQVNNGSARWIDPVTTNTLRFVSKANLQINAFELDSTIAAANNGWFRLGDVMLDAGSSEVYLPDSLHKIKCGPIKLSRSQAVLYMDSLCIVPLYSIAEMQAVHTHQVDRIDMKTDRIVVTGIDIDKMMLLGSLQIQCIDVKGVMLDAFRNKNLPIPPGQFVKLPQLWLRDAGFNIQIDTLKLVGKKIKYEELAKGSANAGHVFFDNVEMEIRGINIDSSQKTDSRFAMMNASGLIMGRSKISIEVKFDMSDANGRHWVKGHMGAFDLRILNQLFEPLAHVSVRSGKTQKLSFNMVLNDNESSGEILFLYDDLKMDKLKEDAGPNEDRELELISFIANTFVIKKSNPSGNKEARIGKVHFKRHKGRSIFNFWWKSVFTGIKPTVMSNEGNLRKR